MAAMALSKLVLFVGAGLLQRPVAGKSALLLIDVQDCFVDDPNLTANGKAGSLGVPASNIIPVINSIREKDCLFDVVIKSQDFHPTNHISFGSTHGLAAFSHLGGKGGLPVSCLKPTTGTTADAACCPTIFVNESLVNCSAQLCPPEGWNYTANNSGFVDGNPACTECRDHPEKCYQDVQAMWTDHCLQSGDNGLVKSMTSKPTDIVVKKGQNRYVDAYSAFMDNSQNLLTGLDAVFQSKNITELHVAGIATDVCVKWTVRDAFHSRTGNYTVKVISDASAGITAAGHDAAIAEMRSWQGVQVVTAAEVLAQKCGGEAGSGNDGEAKEEVLDVSSRGAVPAAVVLAAVALVALQSLA